MINIKDIENRILKEVWPECGKSYDHFQVDIIEYKDCVQVSVVKMYDYVPLSLKQLLILAEIFQTDRFKVNSWHSDGCETCDYGSRYRHEFTFDKADVGVFDAPGLKQLVDK